ncbi:hypothetical protein FQZ97_720300 [compost metagenome]
MALRAVAPDGGARGQAGLGAGGGVFDHQAARRVGPEVGRGGQVHVGVRLGARQVVPAEDALAEVRGHAGHFDLHHHLGLVSAGGACDAAGGVRVRGHDGAQRARHGLQFGAQALVAPRVEGAHPVVGERLAGFGLDARAFVAHGLADEDLHALGLAQGPAGFVEHLAQHAVGDGFAVDQHAVAIEQDRLEHRTHFRSPST